MLGDNFKERFTKLATAHYYQRKTLDSINVELQTLGHSVTGLDAKLSDLDERVTRLATVRRFDETIHLTGYRPELENGAGSWHSRAGVEAEKPLSPLISVYY
jgi:hypothetical protein